MKNYVLPKHWTITGHSNAQRHQQSLLHLDYTVRSLAQRLGADASTADALVLEARSVFTLINSIPRALDPEGRPLLGDRGLPLTVEDWTRRRLGNTSFPVHSS